MKSFIASIVLLAPALVLAAGTPASGKPAAKASAAKPAATAQKAAKAQPTNRGRTTAAATAGVAAAAATGTVAAVAALGPEELSIAERVHTGRIACELGAHVNVQPDTQNPGHFQIDGQGFKYRMVPVTTSTGAVRLEDKHAGAVWLQIANKSMLMNQKLGQRMADECKSPEQVQVAEAIKKNPPPSVLDPR